MSDRSELQRWSAHDYESRLSIKYGADVFPWPSPPTAAARPGRQDFRSRFEDFTAEIAPGWDLNTLMFATLGFNELVRVPSGMDAHFRALRLWLDSWKGGDIEAGMRRQGYDVDLVRNLWLRCLQRATVSPATVAPRRRSVAGWGICARSDLVHTPGLSLTCAKIGPKLKAVDASIAESGALGGSKTVTMLISEEHGSAQPPTNHEAISP